MHVPSIWKWGILELMAYIWGWIQHNTLSIVLKQEAIVQNNTYNRLVPPFIISPPPTPLWIYKRNLAETLTESKEGSVAKTFHTCGK